MLFLGFSAGLPFALIFSTLSLWLNEAGIDKSTNTFFSWALLGYSFKFIWAPLGGSSAIAILNPYIGAQALMVDAVATFSNSSNLLHGQH